MVHLFLCLLNHHLLLGERQGYSVGRFLVHHRVSQRLGTSQSLLFVFFWFFPLRVTTVHRLFTSSPVFCIFLFPTNQLCVVFLHLLHLHHSSTNTFTVPPIYESKHLCWVSLSFSPRRLFLWSTKFYIHPYHSQKKLTSSPLPPPALLPLPSSLPFPTHGEGMVPVPFSKPFLFLSLLRFDHR